MRTGLHGKLIRIPLLLLMQQFQSPCDPRGSFPCRGACTQAAKEDDWAVIRGKRLESRAMCRMVQSNAGWQGGRPRLAAACTYPEDVIHHGCAHIQGQPVAAVANARWGGLVRPLKTSAPLFMQNYNNERPWAFSVVSPCRGATERKASGTAGDAWLPTLALKSPTRNIVCEAQVVLNIFLKIQKCVPRPQAFMCLMVDYFTKAVEFAPIPDKSAGTVARAVHDYWFMRYVMPEWVTTDNGTAFAGAFRHQLERFGIDHVQTSTYRPQSNGAVERLVRTMKDVLAAKDSGGTHDWAALLPRACNIGIRSRDQLNQ